MPNRRRSLQFLAVLIGVFALCRGAAISGNGASPQQEDHERGAPTVNDPCDHAEPSGRAYGRTRVCPPGASSNGITRGDFNGDGIGDLAIGVPFEDYNGVQDSGAVQIIYGSPSGLSATATLPDQFIGYDRANARFGAALASGDFNGDFYSDIAIGAPGDDVYANSRSGVIQTQDGTSNTIIIGETQAPLAADAGVVHIFYGSAAGLDLVGREQHFSLTDLSSLSGVAAPNAGDDFGASLAWGNFNGDAFGDLAIGIPGYDRQGGAVAVIRGNGTGLDLTSRLPQFIRQGANNILDAAEPGDRFGAALVSGNFGGPVGTTDLAVGAPGEDIAGIQDAGAVNVIYGSASGPTSGSNQFWHQNSQDIGSVARASEFFGSSLAAIGANGSDLAIGVPGDDVLILTDPGVDFIDRAGAVNVLFYDPSVNALSAVGNQYWHQNSTDILNSVREGDAFGSALASGDFNGDGLRDLAIGVPGEDVILTKTSNIVDAGLVHVIYYEAIGTGLSATAGPGNQVFTQNTFGILDSAESGDFFGSALSAWEFGNGFLADLAVSVPFESVGTVAGAGAVHVIYGDNTTATPGLTTNGNQLWHQNSTSIEGTAEAGDQFGRTVY